MAHVSEYESDALGARWHRVHVDPVSILCKLAPWQLARDAVAAAIESGDLDPSDESTMLHTLHDRIVTESARLTRAGHTWFHGGTTFGDESEHAPAPDVHERVRAATRKERTRKGATVDMVTVHGRAYVQGSTVTRDHHWQGPTLTGHAAMSAARVDHALRTAPRASHGIDAIAITRLTDIVYGDSIPALIGADVIAWDEYHALTSDSVAWSERTATYRPARHVTRRRLTTIRPRKGETVQRVTFYDGQSITRLLAPDTDPAYAWRGHRRYTRPVTVRATRETRKRVADDVHAIDPAAPLGETLALLATLSPESGNYRATWSHGTMSGSLTVTGSDTRRRYRVTVKGRRGLSITTRRPETLAPAIAQRV
jgi:hypothetical protein